MLAVPHTNTKYKSLLLPTQMGMQYTNTHKHRTSYFKSTLTFLDPAKLWKCLSAADKKGNFCDFFIVITIIENSSTLYVGLACAVPPTNTNFQPLLLPTQAGMPYTNTHKHRTSYFKSTVTFKGPAKRWKCLSAARQKNDKFLRFLIIINFKIFFLYQLI